MTSKIEVNKSALSDLALHGPDALAETFYHETHAACHRLGLPALEPFAKPLRGAGAWPNIHDTIPWLNSVKLDRVYGEDCKFLARLNATLAVRCPALKVKLDAGAK